MEFWENRQVLVTGAGGFIGGHLAVALNQAGANVRGLCRYNSRGDRGTLDWFERSQVAGIEVMHGELRDPESVQHAMAGVQTAFHLGAQIAIPYSYLNPRDFFATNVQGTLNVAQAALAAGAERVIHASTSEVYGNARNLPITEGHPLAPRSPYAASKAAADLLMLSFQHSYGLPIVIARPFNTYGPHQSARAIVPTIITQALGASRIRLGSVHPRRDLTFVTDTVRGLMALAGADAVDGTILHLGTGTDVSVGELVKLLGEILGRTLEVELDPNRIRPPDSEVDRLVSDHGEITRLTGWAPRVDLQSGLRQTATWLEHNQHRYRAGEYAV